MLSLEDVSHVYANAFDTKHVIVLERQPIRSGKQVLRFVTDRRPTHAGIDPYNYTSTGTRATTCCAS